MLDIVLIASLTDNWRLHFSQKLIALRIPIIQTHQDRFFKSIHSVETTPGRRQGQH